MVFRPRFTATLTSPNITLSGSISQFTVYVRQGTEAYDLTVSGTLTSADMVATQTYETVIQP